MSNHLRIRPTLRLSVSPLLTPTSMLPRQRPRGRTASRPPLMSSFYYQSHRRAPLLPPPPVTQLRRRRRASPQPGVSRTIPPVTLPPASHRLTAPSREFLLLPESPLHSATTTATRNSAPPLDWPKLGADRTMPPVHNELELSF
jgi:hypothetical protein